MKNTILNPHILLLIIPLLLLACGKATENKDSQLTIKTTPVAEIQNLLSDDSFNAEISVTVKVSDTLCELTLNADATLKGVCENIPLGTHNYSVIYYLPDEATADGKIILASSNGTLAFAAGSTTTIDLNEINLEYDLDNDGYSNISEISNNSNPQDKSSKPREVASINIENSVNKIIAQETHQLSLTVMDNSDQNYSEAVLRFTSSDEMIATIDENGLITALQTGMVFLSISDNIGNVLEEIEISVVAAPIENEAPVISSSSDYQIDENTTSVAEILATDKEDQVLTYRIFDGADMKSFAIHPNTGELVFNVAPDYERPTDSDEDNVYFVQVEVSDGEKTDVASIIVTVQDVDESIVIAEPPVVSINNANITVAEELGVAILKINLDKTSQTDISVTVNTVTGTASENDFTPLHDHVVLFNAGSLEETLTLSITDDVAYEGVNKEVFSVQLSNVIGANLGSNNFSNISITDDELPPVVNFALANQSVAEEVGTIAIDVSLSTISENVTSVTVNTVTDSASTNDFTMLNNQLISFPAGVTEQTFSLIITDDNRYEGVGSESLFIQLSNPIGGVLGVQTSHQILINDNETLPSLSFTVAELTVAEDVGNVTLTISSSGVSQNDISVDVNTLAGTATNDDFTPINNQLVTIPPGDIQQTINIEILDDSEPEGATAEVFTVQLSNAAGSTLGSSSVASISITDNEPSNTNKPKANAGPDQMVRVNSQVTLDGTASLSFADNPIINFLWTPPANITLSGIGVEQPTFTTPSDLAVGSVLTFSLTVTDSNGLDSGVDTVDVIIVAPVADAGPDRIEPINTSVFLDGSGSTSPDSAQLNFTWSLAIVPDGSAAVLDDVNGLTPSFMPDLPGIYEIHLVVNDGFVDSEISKMSVTAHGQLTQPVADAGNDRTVNIGYPALLDGGDSSDPNLLGLSYIWTLTDSPPSSTAVIVNETADKPDFIPDIEGDYTFSLIVKSGSLTSEPALVLLTAVPLEDNVLKLDGRGDRVDGDFSVLSPGIGDTRTAESFTAEFWMYPESSFRNGVIIQDDAFEVIWEPEDNNNNEALKFSLTYTCPVDDINRSVGIAYGGFSLRIFSWNHIAVQFDATTNDISMWVDGENVITRNLVTDYEVTTTTICNNENKNFTIGGDKDSFSEFVDYFDGRIDEVRVSNIARYQTSFTPEEELVKDAQTLGLWHFNESAGSTTFGAFDDTEKNLSAVGDAATAVQ